MRDIMSEQTQLQELVDTPNETLDVEYKEWLDLSKNEIKAGLAKHIAALANHGGGYIVLGFKDSMEFAGKNPFQIIDRDVIAGIVKKYLDPTFQCDVNVVTSKFGNEHPVITVPPHGPAPICSKCNGPDDQNHKPIGITQGTYYTRKAGPESAPVLTPTDWSPIIRRCAMHERTAILSAIDTALRGASGILSVEKEDTLKTWHDAAHAAFLRDIAKYKAPEELKKWHWQFSYSIERADGQRLDPNKMIEVLQQVNREVHDLVRSGWSMFYVYTRQGMAPTFVTDNLSGQGEHDFLECSLSRAQNVTFPAYDLWRMSSDGCATIIRPYWEDSPDFKTQPGTWFSPNFLAQNLAEIVRHARGVAERFESPTSVTFRCEWDGLSGRVIWDPLGRWPPDQSPAQSDYRITPWKCPITMLENGWPEIIVKLAASVIRAFPISFTIDEEWVRGQKARWLHV
jgi:hypothetical protein